ncbi:MAG: hypothetical protein M3Z03_04945 [Actinomycetota bacterium]|nr:hypothetical protein [Actinomycetota bacterium]
MRTRSMLAALPFALGSLLLPACGDDDGDTNTPNTAPSEVDGGEADGGGTDGASSTVPSESGGSDGTQGNQMTPGETDGVTPSTAAGAATG